MRLYVDTNVIVYAVEGLSDFRAPARSWLAHASQARAEFLTSFFTEFECHVGPFREKNFGMLDTYSAFLRQPSWLLIPISFDILRRAAAIRGEYNLKSPDAIQAATCIETRCDIFLTNDRERFERLPDLPVAEFLSDPAPRFI